MYRPAAHIQDDELYLPAGQLGMGWWGDAWDEVKSVAKKVQANPVVRGLEKKAVDYGSKALRGAAESAVDGLADSALSAVGAPELAPMADKLIDKGACCVDGRQGPLFAGRQVLRRRGDPAAGRQGLRLHAWFSP